MKLIKQLNTTANTKPPVSEDAGGAVGAGGVATMHMPLFATLVRRSSATTKIPVAKSPLQQMVKKPHKKKTLGLAEAYQALSEDDAAAPDMKGANTANRNFDSTSIIAKLKGLERKNEVDTRDTVAFGLEDDDGGVVRVSVKSDQAAEFEKALQSLMVDREDSGDEVPEIAEVLFKLKDHFDIVDIAWPEVVEDEEEQQALDVEGQGVEGQEGDMEGEMGDMGEPGADTGQVQDLLTQVIDMMKADAEARKAEALAREAEAKTKQADAIVAQTMARVKQEEQYLDMESHQKSEKDQTKEAKRLAQLAKWKHSMSGDSGGNDFTDDAPIQPRREAAPEEEEITYQRPAPVRAQPTRRSSTTRGRVAPHDIAQFIIGRVK